MSQAMNTTGPMHMDDVTRRGIAGALGRVPSGLFVLTARHEDRRAGMLASWVQQVCFEPPMISVAVAKGRPLMPLISESRRFGLCQIAKGEKVILRKFAGGIDPGDDPFLGFDMIPNTHVPILANVVGWMECELRCHMDVEGDHDLFVGLIKAGNFFEREPHVHLRDNGFKY
jgi:flavin reductase (DIM6/NTAB) family NADH-FMN oxidoreductase RutF